MQLHFLSPINEANATEIMIARSSTSDNNSNDISLSFQIVPSRSESVRANEKSHRTF